MLFMEQTYFHYKDIYDWGDGFPSEVRVRGQVTLDMIQETLSSPEYLPSIGIPFTFGRDQIQTGGMFNKQVQDCLLLINAEHQNDYFKFVFTTRTTGTVSTIGIYHCGSSAYIGKANLKEFRKNSDFALDRIAGFFTTTNSQAMQEENDYYMMVFDVLKKLLGV